MTGVDAIDRERLTGLDKVMGQAGYEAFIDSAETAVADLLQRLEHADQSQNTALFRDAVHGLSGLLANIGMDGLAASARLLPRPPDPAWDQRRELARAIADAMTAARAI